MTERSGEYNKAFQKTALMFHIPMEAWNRPEVQDFVTFTNRLEELHKDMLAALDSAIFADQAYTEAVTEIKGIDESHTLPNLDGVYKAIEVAEHLVDIAEFIMRLGFDGDFLKHLEEIKSQMTHAAKVLVMPLGKAMLPHDEYG